MSNEYKIEWIPKLLDHLSSLPDLEEELLSDIILAQACLAAKSSIPPVKSTPLVKKRKKHPPHIVTLSVNGSLPHNLSEGAFRAAVIPMFEDLFGGEVTYHGFNRMNNGTYCYNFSGICPIHLREHDGGARIWQIKQHKQGAWCGFKCWRNDGYKKLYCNENLIDF